MKLKMVWIFYKRRMLPVPSSKTKGKQTKVDWENNCL